ncbi:hypothetical protein WN51_08644 [Melipona quadrifasciata]|uniref:Uncharacterized protein n=1 Tax=Melipona quadrifasciata TaxID=166423 RepID=A0A0M9A7L7_9HYME|nr:hypothetical protein WN51_08644 [Melipona quadrifasciata]
MEVTLDLSRSLRETRSSTCVEDCPIFSTRKEEESWSERRERRKSTNCAVCSLQRNMLVRIRNGEESYLDGSYGLSSRFTKRYEQQLLSRRLRLQKVEPNRTYNARQSLTKMSEMLRCESSKGAINTVAMPLCAVYQTLLTAGSVLGNF